MADPTPDAPARPARPWLKLWRTFRTDPGIQALSFEDQARWIHLLILVAENGQDGVWARCPTGALRHLYVRRGSRTSHALKSLLQRLPGVTCVTDPDGDPSHVTVTFVNWRKYQDSSSSGRTKRWRESRHGDGPHTPSTPSHPVTQGTVTVTPDVTKRRGDVEENPLSPVERNGHGDPQALTLDGFPRVAFRTDCPDPAWRGRCVDPAFTGAPRPRAIQCPHHRPAPSPIPPPTTPPPEETSPW